MSILTFFTFDLYHITTFKVELSSNMLYKKGAKFIMDTCCLEKHPKYSKTAFKDFKVFTGLWLHHLTTFTGGWPGDLSETENKAISASIEI